MILKTWEQKQLSVKEKKMFKEEKQREQTFTQEIYSPKFTVRNYFSRSKILQKEKKKCVSKRLMCGGRGEYTLYIISIKLSQLVSFNQFSETIFSYSFFP